MKHRKPLKITSRTSSVTNGFVQAILPDFPPTLTQRAEMFQVLGIDPVNILCVYCGDTATDWDHLKPLVKAKRPTGYLTDYRNLVPACGRCNQSKSGFPWRDWMMGTAVNAPKSRCIPDLEERIERLETYERWSNSQPIDFAAIVGEEIWSAYWVKLAHIERLMHEAQKDAVAIKSQLTKALAPTED